MKFYRAYIRTVSTVDELSKEQRHNPARETTSVKNNAKVVFVVMSQLEVTEVRIEGAEE